MDEREIEKIKKDINCIKSCLSTLFYWMINNPCGLTDEEAKELNARLEI